MNQATDSPGLTLAKGLQILEAFSDGSPSLGNSDFCRITGLNKSTVSRLSKTLCERGYLLQSPTTGKFSLGLATLSLAYPLLVNLPIRRIAHPLLQELAEASHGVASLGMRDRFDLVLIESCRKSEYLSTRPEIGARRPLYTGMLGHVFLAGLPPAVRETLFEEMNERGLADVSALREAVASRVQEMETRRFCFMTAFGNNVIARTFRASRLGEFGMVYCAVEEVAMTKEELLASVPKRLLAITSALEQALGTYDSELLPAWI